MPNIATVLKAEIARIARKVAKSEIEKLQFSASQQRKQIVDLKRQIAGLEKSIRAGSKLAKKTDAKSTPDTESGESDRQVRFSATRLAAQRKRLGLSANDFGRLIGVSGQSIYKWESKGVRPRQSQILAIADARKLTKAEAIVRLAQMPAVA